jgi:Domain of unknown function (DUF4336)
MVVAHQSAIGVQSGWRSWQGTSAASSDAHMSQRGLSFRTSLLLETWKFQSLRELSHVHPYAPANTTAQRSDMKHCARYFFTTLLCQDKPSWLQHIDLAVFAPPVMGLGPTNELVFFHRASQTLLVTDTVIYIGSEPPDIIPVPALLSSAVSSCGVICVFERDMPTSIIMAVLNIAFPHCCASR